MLVMESTLLGRAFFLHRKLKISLNNYIYSCITKKIVIRLTYHKIYSKCKS